MYASHHRKIQGYTHVWNGDADVAVTDQLLSESTQDPYAWCTCASRMKLYYGPTALADCDADCPTGLACFGYQCIGQDEYCVHQTHQFTVHTPPIKTVALKWVPPKDSSAKCRGYAAKWNAELAAHEAQHVANAQEAIAQYNNKQVSLSACASSEDQARANIAAQLEDVKQQIQRGVFKADEDLDCAYHKSLGTGCGDTEDEPEHADPLYCNLCGE